ncbi:MAG: hypothetical protein ACC618_00265 [Patescibacteria group bacterium]
MREVIIKPRKSSLSRTWCAAFLISAFTIGIVFVLQSRLPPEVPLFYGLPKGEDQLAQKLALIAPSVVSLIIIFVNLSISQLSKDEFLKKALALASLTSVFLSAITTAKISFLVGNL